MEQSLACWFAFCTAVFLVPEIVLVYGGILQTFAKWRNKWTVWDDQMFLSASRDAHTPESSYRYWRNPARTTLIITPGIYWGFTLHCPSFIDAYVKSSPQMPKKSHKALKMGTGQDFKFQPNYWPSVWSWANHLISTPVCSSVKCALFEVVLKSRDNVCQALNKRNARYHGRFYEGKLKEEVTMERAFQMKDDEDAALFKSQAWKENSVLQEQPWGPGWNSS